MKISLPGFLWGFLLTIVIVMSSNIGRGEIAERKGSWAALDTAFLWYAEKRARICHQHVFSSNCEGQDADSVLLAGLAASYRDEYERIVEQCGTNDYAAFTQLYNHFVRTPEDMGQDSKPHSPR